MKRLNDLEQRLTDWAREYGGGRYEDTGWQGISPLAQMMKYQGRAPQGLAPPRVGSRSPADDVQDAVRALEMQKDGYRPAQVLRMEYLHPGKPFQSKQQGLRRLGQGMGRSDYYKALKIARVHVAAWLRIRFCDLENDSVQVA